MTPRFAPDEIIGRQTRGLKQPAAQRLVMPQLRRLFRQDDVDRLRDFLRVMRIAHLPQRDGINQIDVPYHQRGKRLVGIIVRILPQQRAVVRWLHSPISVRRPAKADNLFAIFNDPKSGAAGALALLRIHRSGLQHSILAPLIFVAIRRIVKARVVTQAVVTEKFDVAGMAVHETAHVQGIIDLVRPRIGQRFRFVPGIGEAGRLIHRHHGPDRVADGADFPAGNSRIILPGHGVRPQIQPAEPVARIIRPRIVVHAGMDERCIVRVEIIKRVGRAGEELVLGRGLPGQAVVALGEFLEETPLIRPGHAVGDDDVRQRVVVVAGIQMDADADLPQIADAIRPLRRRLGMRQRRQQQRRQNGDDGDDHQQFNQRERRALPVNACWIHGFDSKVSQLKTHARKCRVAGRIPPTVNSKADITVGEGRVVRPQNICPVLLN